MAYFECIIGGAGTTLTVTCDSVFAGKTITCTNGTTTLTATCPSASPYIVEFDVETDGTWTISGTVNGKTHSISITLNTSGTLHEIPTGSSVTPVANVQTWLHCANIWDKSYTTINQVLADASTLQALIASNNAADYMARSTSWASTVTANSSAMTYIGANNYCANKLLADSTWLNAICNSTYMESVLNVKVPTMTSATAPSGVVTQSSTYSSAGYMAFDGNDTTGWVPTYVSSKADYSDWLGYEFTSNVLIKCVKLRVDSGSFNVSSCKYKLQQYNGSTWIDVGSAGTISQNAQIKNYTLPRSGGDKLKKYRVIFDSLYVAGQYQAYIRTMQLYGRS